MTTEERGAEPQAELLTQANHIGLGGTPPSLLLGLSGLGLWGVFIFACFVFFNAHNVQGMAAMRYALVLLYICLPICAVAIVLLLTYTVIKKPWQPGSRCSWAYWSQVPLAILAAIGIGWVIHRWLLWMPHMP